MEVPLILLIHRFHTCEFSFLLAFICSTELHICGASGNMRRVHRMSPQTSLFPAEATSCFSCYCKPVLFQILMSALCFVLCALGLRRSAEVCLVLCRVKGRDVPGESVWKMSLARMGARALLATNALLCKVHLNKHTQNKNAAARGSLEPNAFSLGAVVQYSLPFARIEQS